MPFRFSTLSFGSVARAALCLLLAGVGTTAHAQYTFTRIADTTDGFSGFDFGGLSINESGMVAFLPSYEGVGLGVSAGSGGPLTTIVGPDVFDGIIGASINDSGFVAFRAWTNTQNGTDEKIVMGNGGPLTTVFEATGNGLEFVSNPTLRNDGAVAFRGQTSQPDSILGIYTVAGPGAAPDLIADETGELGFISQFEPAYTDSGLIAFQAELDGGGQGIFLYDGLSLTTLIDSSSEYDLFTDPVISQDGSTIIFSATTDEGDAVLLRYAGGAVSLLLDTSGILSSFGDRVAVTNSGLVIFNADLDDSFDTGIFTYDGVTLSTVIKQGDTLFGETVTNVGFKNAAVNESGQFAFTYRLESRIVGVGLATPTAVTAAAPEPATLPLLALMGVPLLGYRRKTNSCHKAQ